MNRRTFLRALGLGTAASVGVASGVVSLPVFEPPAAALVPEITISSWSSDMLAAMQTHTHAQTTRVAAFIPDYWSSVGTSAFSVRSDHRHSSWKQFGAPGVYPYKRYMTRAL